MTNFVQEIFSNVALPERINALEKEMLKQEQVECPVIHRFSPGVYVREVSIPAGTLAIGHRQKTEHLNVFLKGKVTMLNEDGSTTELTAPMIFTGKPGRKCGYITEDVVWLNVYPTEETDIEKLESIYLDKTLTFEESDKIRLLTCNHADREDYRQVLVEFGFTEEIARRQSENELDQIPFPHGGYKVGVFNSPIEGKGLFATASIAEGEVIAPARIDGMRTPAGRFTNHAKEPNAEMVRIGENIYLKATKDIAGCKGGHLGEEITINYRQALRLNGEMKCLESQQQ
jgi:hypothetical protein